MRWLVYAMCALALAGCAAFEKQESPDATAQVGIVNHTEKYIYSVTVDGSGGGNMSAWGAGGADICCTSIPRIWYPGMKVLVRWNMPEGTKDVIKEKLVEIEKYSDPGSIYMHFFPNDEVRVVVSNYPGYSSAHPIARPIKPTLPPSSQEKRCSAHPIARPIKPLPADPEKLLPVIFSPPIHVWDGVRRPLMALVAEGCLRGAPALPTSAVRPSRESGIPA
jgi:hypothetical protein